MSRSNDIANITASVLDGVTAAEVGLGNVDNTSDANKPVSTAQQSAIDGLAYQSVPHIIPDVLYPAVAGKLLDGTTTHGTGTYGGSAVSTNYGTTQSDGRKYYYTDIKGSKPIKDPRIGGHFGSQRCTMRSWQLLEQETAMEGYDVYSVDGREWMRINDMGQGVTYGNNPDGGDGVLWEFNGSGAYLEVTGYFSAANMLWFPHASGDDFNWKLDGASAGSVSSGVSISSPLGNRFVNCGSVYNLPFSSPLTTPGIHTIKLVATSDDFVLQGFELIAQDTTSTENRSKIQIPSQNVVSYGKKFNVSGTPHYDPFNGFTSGSSVTSYIDTATSLGVENWKNSSTYYRPYNGGRVVKWVDSSGVIKTSVTLMPPNAQNFAGSSSSPKANASVANNTYLPTFSGAIEHSLSEVAKTFHFREFGNGAANEGSTTSGNWQDTSMLGNPADDISYVMDDGLTSISGNDISQKDSGVSGRPVGLGMASNDDGDYFIMTFIGTGISFDTEPYGTAGGTATIFQNLPFGTHVLKTSREGASGGIDPVYTLDGVAFSAFDLNTYGAFSEVTFHQPKRPPIPEDACVLADYMLMADFVGEGSSSSASFSTISKGVRRCDSSRDVFYNTSGSANLQFVPSFYETGRVELVHGGGTPTVKLPFFGTNVVTTHRESGNEIKYFNIDATATSSAEIATTETSVFSSFNQRSQLNVTQTLGSHVLNGATDSGTSMVVQKFDVVSPIHTSSHYQTFETPFLHELVGGDRNMEQTNLVVSPDGKTWDEVTRDTSYLGNTVVFASRDGGNTTADGVHIWDYWRGAENARNYFCKEFAIGYDRLICLKEGFYEIHTEIKGWENHHMRGYIRINGVNENWMELSAESSQHGVLQGTLTIFFKRGDYVDVYRDEGDWFGGILKENHLTIKRV